MPTGSVIVLCGTATQERARLLDEHFVRAGTRRAFLVLPTEQYALWRAEHIARHAPSGGIWGDHVLSFHRFAIKLLEQQGCVYQATDVDRFLLLQTALETVESSVPEPMWREALRLPGVASHLQRIIEALKQAAVDPEQFAAAIKSRSRFSSRDVLVAEVYAAYQRLLQEQGLYDRIGTLWAAAEVCERETPRLLQSTEVLLFDGFDDFTLSELRLIEKIAPHASKIIIGLNYDPDPEKRDIYRLQAKTFEYLRHKCNAVGEFLASPAASSFSQLAAQRLILNGDPPELTGLRPNITVTGCSFVLDEAEFVARETKRLLVSGQAAEEEICIAYTDLSSVCDLVVSVFEGVGIPVVLDRPLCVAETGIGAFLLGVGDALINDWPAVLAADLFASPWFPPSNDVEERAMHLVPSLGRVMGVTSGLKEWETALTRLLNPSPNEEKFVLPAPLSRIPELRRLLEALRRRIHRIQEYTSLLPQEASIPEFANALARFIKVTQFRNGFCTIQGTNPTVEQIALKRIDEALGRLHFGSLKTSSPPQTVSRDRFFELLRYLFHLDTVPAPMEQQGVRITTLDKMRNLVFRWVFLCGVNEGLLPTPRAPNAIYGNEDIEDLRQNGLPIETARENVDSQRIVFQHALRAATEHLHITWRLMAPDGREMRRSPFLVELLRLFERNPIEQTQTGQTVIVPNPENIFSLRDLRAAAVFRKAPFQTAFGGELETSFRGAALEYRRYSAAPFDEYDGVLKTEAAKRVLKEQFLEERIYSVSQIERFITCPFAYFIEHILHVEPIEEFTKKWETAERGLILHDVLAWFHNKHAGVPLGKIPEAKKELFERAKEIFERRKQRTPENLHGRLFAEYLAVLRLLEKYVQNYSDKEDLWEPRYFEVFFGYETNEIGDTAGHPKPYVLETEQGNIKFRGRIDRIDWHSGNFRVVDYKTTSAPSFKSIQEGKSIQLPIYVQAAETVCFPGETCVEARYIAINRKPFKKVMNRDDQETWDQCLDSARDSIARTIRSIQDGRFPPTPLKDACRYCNNRSVCRYEEMRIERKAQGVS